MKTIELDSTSLRMTPAIRKCNRILRREFGDVNGRPRFQWMLTSQIYWDRCVEEKMQPVETPVYAPDGRLFTKLVVMKKVHEHQSMAQRMGADAWCIGQWQLPLMTEKKHNETFGNDVPYNGGGKWIYVDGTNLNLGNKPTMDITAIVIETFHKAMATTVQDCVNEAVIEREVETKETIAKAEEMLDGVLTIRGNKPGGKEDVSYPPVQKSIIIQPS